MLNNRLKKSFQISAQCFVLLFFAVIAPLFLFASSASSASAETRSLKLYYIHTREKEEIVFKRNGRYDQAGLKKLNYFLRDWRRNEPAKMDPRLFDLIWTVYQLSGSRDYIHVVSAYRSPATNNMLRSRSKNSGVAKNSQHTLGHAMDFYIPDVKLATLRAIGMKQGVGGVGYYPTSGSPFMHMDTGSVRHWPRMSRRELMALFPDGKTMHLPTDGKPLQGYQQALAEYKARGGQPASRISGSTSEKKKGGGLFGLFGKKDEAPAPTPQKRNQNQNAPIQNEPVEPDPVQMVDLPGNDAPIPAFSPSRDVEEEEDEAIVASFGNVPLPNYKPADQLSDEKDPVQNPVQAVADQNTTQTELAQTEVQPQENTVVANVPVPVPSPVNGIVSPVNEVANNANGADGAAGVVPEGANNVVASNTTAPEATSETTVAEVVMPASFPVPTENPFSARSGDAVQMANAARNTAHEQAGTAVNNQVNTASANNASVNNDVPVMAYSNGQNSTSSQMQVSGAQMPETRMVAGSDQMAGMMAEGNSTSNGQQLAYANSQNSARNNSSIEVIPVPKDDDEAFDRNKKVRGGSSPASNVLNQMGGSSNQVVQNATQNGNINNELREIPSVVFVSRLEKEQKTSSQYSSLSGHAVDFHPVTQVYK